MVLARRDTHQVLKLVDWHLLVFFAALFVVVDRLSDTGLPDAIYRHLQPMFGVHPHSTGLEFVLVCRGRLKHFFQRPVCACGGKMDPAFCRPGADLEGARAGDHFRRQSHHHRFSGEHDRCRICAGTS